MDLRLATSCVLAIVAACSRGEKKPTPAVANAHEQESSAADMREQLIAAEPLRSSAERLCDAFDSSAVAKVMGWQELEPVGSFGSSNRESWSCHFMAKDHPDGAGFGVAFTTTLQFMETHLEAPYVPRDPIAGHDAVVAKHADGKIVSIQVHARGITIETNANDAGSPDDVEVRLADATIKLLETLTADPAAALRE